MKIKYVVMEYIKKGQDREIKRFDSYEEAEQRASNIPRDLMGSPDYYILKIFSHKD